MYVYVHTDTKNIHMHAKGTVLFVKPCTLITFLQVVSHRNLAEGTFAGINMEKKKIPVSSKSCFYVKYTNAVN